MIYKRYTVEINGQILSVDLATINNSVKKELKDNKISFTEIVLENERDYDYFKDTEKSEQFLESLTYLLHPNLKENMTKLNHIVEKLDKEFSKFENIYINHYLNLDDGFIISISFDYRDSFIPLYNFKYDKPLVNSVNEETEKLASYIYSYL